MRKHRKINPEFFPEIQAGFLHNMFSDRVEKLRQRYMDMSARVLDMKMKPYKRALHLLPDEAFTRSTSITAKMKIAGTGKSYKIEFRFNGAQSELRALSQRMHCGSDPWRPIPDVVRSLPFCTFSSERVVVILRQKTLIGRSVKLLIDDTDALLDEFQETGKKIRSTLDSFR